MNKYYISDKEKSEIKTMYEKGDTLCHIAKKTNRCIFSIRRVCVLTETTYKKEETLVYENKRKCKICGKRLNGNPVYVGRYGICQGCFGKCWDSSIRKLEKLRNENENNIVLNTKT